MTAWWQADGNGAVVVLHQGHVASELLSWVRGLPPTVKLYEVEGRQIPRQRNMGIDANRARDWVCFLDSDCVPPHDALSRLVERGVPLVGAVVLERFAPFRPAALRSWGTDEAPTPMRLGLGSLQRRGLMRVAAVGTAFMLIRRAVWEALEEPWFRCGQIEKDLLLEDFEFCRRASEAGYGPYLDCDVRVGHKVEGATLWPGVDGSVYAQWKGPGAPSIPIQALDPDAGSPASAPTR